MATMTATATPNLSLYKTQVKELKEEVDEKNKQIQDLTSDIQNMLQEKDSIGAQLQLALAKADSEQLARQIAEEQLSDVEKEKTMLDLEIKEFMSRHKSEMNKKDSMIAALEKLIFTRESDIERLVQEKNEANKQIKAMSEDMAKNPDNNEIEELKKQLEDEKLKKIQAVNKVAEIMNKMVFADRHGGKNKSAEAELKCKEKENRKLQQELTMEREKYNKMIEKMQRDVLEAQQSVYEESQARQRLQMEIDAKDSEMEQLRQKLSLSTSDSLSLKSRLKVDRSTSLHRDFIPYGSVSFRSAESIAQSTSSVAPATGSLYSGNNEDSIMSSSEESAMPSDTYMEGWLAVPQRNDIKKYGWKKQFVVVSSRKVLFYASENEKQNTDPVMVLDIDKLFHVRPVSQGDVYRADAKDIPKIFQILYASEGENRKPEDGAQEAVSSTTDRVVSINYKGHDFTPFTFRTPTSCDSCHKLVWHVIHPPPALECKRCHVKVHRDHYDKNEEFIAYCKVTYDSSIQAKELLLLAESTEKQKTWVQHLSKKISKKEIVSTGNLGTARGSKQYVSYGHQQRGHLQAGKATTLPPQNRNS